MTCLYPTLPSTWTSQKWRVHWRETVRATRWNGSSHNQPFFVGELLVSGGVSAKPLIALSLRYGASEIMSRLIFKPSGLTNELSLSHSFHSRNEWYCWCKEWGKPPGIFETFSRQVLKSNKNTSEKIVPKFKKTYSPRLHQRQLQSLPALISGVSHGCRKGGWVPPREGWRFFVADFCGFLVGIAFWRLVYRRCLQQHNRSH